MSLGFGRMIRRRERLHAERQNAAPWAGSAQVLGKARMACERAGQLRQAAAACRSCGSQLMDVHGLWAKVRTTLGQCFEASTVDPPRQSWHKKSGFRQQPDKVITTA